MENSSKSQQHAVSYIIPLLLMMIYFSVVGWETETFCFFIVLTGLYYATIHGGPYATPIILVSLMLIYFWMALWYKQKYGQYRSTPESVELLLTIRKQILSTIIDPLAHNTTSVCKNVLDGSKAYGLVAENTTALVNWRPLTVRLAGYLGGINSTYDGVFDMTKGIQLALSQGARAFFFDIDYLDVSPCKPVVVNRDDSGYMRSLHTGSIKEACQTLADKAFETNYDPVIVMVYMRRIPEGMTQQSKYLSAIAQQLNPLSKYHLGSTEQGNFYNCLSESTLFTSPITNYQKKFIVLTNYDTSAIVSNISNPTDNLHFWTNARIYRDPSGLGSGLGNVTPAPPPSPPPYAQIGVAKQFINISKADQPAFIQGTTSASANTFKIALGPVNYSFSTGELMILLNQLGIQCVPIDVVALSALPAHDETIKAAATAPETLSDLTVAINLDDPMSFWAYSGWSRKLLKGEPTTTTNLPVPIQGYVPAAPTPPKAPSQATNSQGGMVSIR